MNPFRRIKLVTGFVSLFSSSGRARGISLTGMTLAAALPLAACTQGNSSPASTGPIGVGTDFPLTGYGASAGQAFLEGATVAIKAINDSGGVTGRNLLLLPGDDHSDPVDAIPVVTQQIDVSHITVGMSTALTFAAVSRYFHQGNVPVAIMGGDVSLNKITDPLFWRSNPSDDELGVAMALYAYKKGYRKSSCCSTRRTMDSRSSR